jgi:hypothetical protein
MRRFSMSNKIYFALVLLFTSSYLWANADLAALAASKTYIQSCSSQLCQNVFNYCSNEVGCFSEFRCKLCFLYSDVCDLACWDDLFDIKEYALIDGEKYLRCDAAFAHQVNACQFVCRTNSMNYSACVEVESDSICKCSSLPLSTVTTTKTSSTIVTTIPETESTTRDSTVSTASVTSPLQLVQVWSCNFDSNNACGGTLKVTTTSGTVALSQNQLITYLNSYYISDVTSISKWQEVA